MYVTPVIGPVTSGATGVFGIGNTFGGVSGNYWAAFVSRGDEDILYAELNLDGAVQRLKIGLRTSFNSSLRIEPTEGGFAFYNQSKLITTLQGTFPDDVERRLLMGSHGEALEMHVYHVAAGPFTSGGTYTSPVYDESVSGGWGRLVESSFEQLQGTSLMYETRTGQTATPDDSWSAWEVVGEDDLIVSPEGRYIQFRVTFVTADPDRTPMWFGLLYEIRPAA